MTPAFSSSSVITFPASFNNDRFSLALLLLLTSLYSFWVSWSFFQILQIIIIFFSLRRNYNIYDDVGTYAYSTIYETARKGCKVWKLPSFLNREMWHYLQTVSSFLCRISYFFPFSRVAKVLLYAFQCSILKKMICIIACIVSRCTVCNI